MGKELLSLLVIRWNVGGYHSQPPVSSSLAVASKEDPLSRVEPPARRLGGGVMPPTPPPGGGKLQKVGN